MEIIDTYRHKGLRRQMVDRLRSKGITNEDVLKVMEDIPRHAFLDSTFTEIAYKEDVAFQIGSGQTISQAYTVAFQTDLLSVRQGCKVLEIGTGSGYQACVLAALGCKVYTVERQRNLYLKTQPFLNEYNFRINTFLGDGFAGLPTYAPFDRILITAAAPEIPQALTGQLKNGGIIVVPLDNENQSQTMLRLTKNDDGTFSREEFGEFRFVPMLKNIGND